MFNSLKAHKILVSVFLLVAVTFSSLAPMPAHAGGGGSGDIFNFFVAIVVVVVVAVVLPELLTYVVQGLVELGATLGPGTVLGGLALDTAFVINTGLALFSDTVLGSAISLGNILYNVADAGATLADDLSKSGATIDQSPTLTNVQSSNPDVQYSETTTQDSVLFDSTSVGIGLVGACPEGHYNSQNKTCVPIGQQSCLDIGIQGACPAGYSCSTAYGGSCSRGREKQSDVTTDFSTSLPEPSIGESMKLIWDSTGATYCDMNKGIGGVYANGYLPLSFSKPGVWDFVIRCAGEGGETKEIITITIPEVVTKLTTSRTFVAKGNPFRITWTSSDAQICAIDNKLGQVPLQGSLRVSFGTVGDKTMTFACRGRGGETTSSVNIKVVTEQEYLDTLTGVATAPGVVQADDASLDPLTAPINSVNVPQSVINSLTSTSSQRSR